MKNSISLAIAFFLLVGAFTSIKVETARASGTIYIRNNGSIDPPTASISTIDNVTYKLIDNIYGSIVVERANIVLDGIGYNVLGSGVAQFGFNLTDISNVTIKNTNIKGFSYGVFLVSTSHITISENNITNNSYGIVMSRDNNSTISENNMIANTVFGIELWGSLNSTISGNNVENSEHGVWLYYSSNNFLRNNSMNGSKYNFAVQGSELLHFTNNIDASNSVNSRPVYYWINKQDTVVPLDAGYVALVNCTNMKIENLDVTNNGQGILLAYTTNSTIAKSSITNNWIGMMVYYDCNNNTISENNVTANEVCGIQIYDSSDNTVSGNTIENNEIGLYLTISSNSVVSGNNITSNLQHGIYLSGSSFHHIYRNNIVANSWDGIRLYESSNNVVSSNNITANNDYGICLYHSSSNSIYHNGFFENNIQAYFIPGYVLANVWDDNYPSGGNYWSDYNGTDLLSGPYQNETGSDGIGDSPYVIDSENTDHYPLAEPWVAPDLSIAKMKTSKTGCTPLPTVCQNYTVTVHAEIENTARIVQSLKLRVYANETLIKEFEDTYILNGTSMAYVLEWDTHGFTNGNYTLSAVVEPVPEEINTLNNMLVCWILVTSPGDINADQAVDIFDCASVALAFSSTPNDPNWSPNSDINNDGIVDIFDLVVVALHFGETA